MRRSSRLKADRSHGPPEKHRGRKVCSRCGRPYRFRSKTGLWTKEPWGPCPGMKETELDRSSRLSPVSDTNSGREHQRDDAFREYVRGLACVACGEPPPSDPAHVRSWGAGNGDWLIEGDVGRAAEQAEAGRCITEPIKGTGNLVSLCRPCHSEQHTVGIESFGDEHDVDLAAEARRIGRAYREGEA